ncbi:MAG: type II toxin-antitoxin system VapC family toxin [Thaumarchaeota archaeon]|nr:type II toxin-antitoxin system VapC family toxin [Nitrososphaerota archaeon]
MAHPRRDQEHLGIDTNVLVAYLDRDHPSHGRTERLSNRAVALNPTVIHEAYHTLVFKMKWQPKEAARILAEASTEEQNLFINQTLTTTKMGLHLASRHGLGGRDALILANFLAGGIRELVTLDDRLIALKKVRYGKRALTISQV